MDISPSAQANALPLGVYQHYKGGVYEVLCVGRLTEEEDVECVVYRSLENGLVWIRPFEIFLEEVEWQGEQKPRFVFQEIKKP